MRPSYWLVSGKNGIWARALGNRSILADPSNPEMKKIINSKIKKGIL